MHQTADDTEMGKLSCDPSPSLLEQGARAFLGFDLSTAQVGQFEVYYQELVAWNQRMNLTAIVDWPDVQVKHFLDSLSFVLAFPSGACKERPSEAESGRTFSLMDVGSGAGFPGIPLKIVCPGLALTCVDSVGKKTGFVRHIAQRLDLKGVVAITARAEELAREPGHRERYDIVVSRAVAELRVLSEYCLPLVAVGGIFIAAKRAEVAEEVAAARGAIGVLGGRLSESVPVDLPGLIGQRQLIVIEKVRATPAKYPRRAGMPQRKPV